MAKKHSKSIIGNAINNMSYLELAFYLKHVNKNIDYFYDIILFIIDYLFMSFAYMTPNNSIIKILTIINIGAHIIVKALIHINFYNLLYKNKESKRLKILGVSMIIFIFFTSFLWLFLFMSLIKNINLLKLISGWLSIIIGIIIVLLGIADKTIWVFVDGMEKIKND